MSFEINKNGIVRFAFTPKKPVKKVSLVGSFNGWKPETMRKQKNGQYIRKVEVPCGTHYYKFIVDTTWEHDTDNETCLPNEMGTLNSVITVE